MDHILEVATLVAIMAIRVYFILETRRHEKLVFVGARRCARVVAVNADRWGEIYTIFDDPISSLACYFVLIAGSSRNGFL